MLNAKKWLAMLLAISLLFNLIPINVLAEDIPDISVEAAQEESPVAQDLEPSPEEDSQPLTGDSETELNEGGDTPVEGGNMPVEDGDMSIEGGNATIEGGNTPIERGNIPIEGGDTLVEDGTASAENEDPSASAELQSNEELDETPVPLFNDSFANSFAVVLNNNGYSSNLITENGSDVTLDVSDGKILALLSQQTQTYGSNYQNWTISFGATGGIVLDDTFEGLGSVDFPFKGTFSSYSAPIKTKHTLFNCLSSEATLNPITIKWAGPQNEAIFAEHLTLNKDYIIPMPVSFEEKNNNNINDPRAFSPFLGTVSGAFTTTLPALDYSNADPQSFMDTTNNFGLLCRQIDTGACLKVSNLTLPNDTQLHFSTSANTGGLVGYMNENSKLIIAQDMDLSLLLIGENAGGLVGNMETGATIVFQDGAGVDVTATLKATNNAGGVAGTVTTQNGPLSPFEEPSAQADDDPLKNVRICSVQANGVENAGILYGTCTVTGSFNPFDGVSFTDGAVREVSGAGNCGGVFGTLTIEDEGKCNISSENTSSTLNFTNEIDGASNTGKTTQYGGIAGTLSDGARKNALVVDQCSITSIVSVGSNTDNYPKYIGGIVAVQGMNTTVNAKSSTVTISNPKTPTNTYGIGGLCTEVGNGALLMAETMTVVIDAFVENQGSSGVAASTGKGAVVYLKSSLDLSNCLLSTCSYSGQIVGKQDCSLIYAPGVAISRLKTDSYNGVELDDIGNYGELYRIITNDQKSPFFDVDKDYGNVFNHSVTKDNTEEYIGYTLSTKEDYACFALAWQSRGYFPTVKGITKDNWDSQKATFIGGTINLKNSIDLTNCGIGGLTRDVYSTDDTFTGTFNGGDYSITLDIGAANVSNGITTGDGRIYWHNATGLFAAIANTATVKNLTLAGSIRLSNNTKTASTMSCGALAAKVTTSGPASTSMLEAVSTKVKFDAICSGASGSYILYLGGLFGLVDAGQKTIINFTTGANLAPTIIITYNKNCTGSYNHFGGAIGAISGNGVVEINCNGATIGDTTSNAVISNQGSNNPYNMYVGGLVGTIWSGTNTRNISISNLGVNGFTYTGSASQRMGGILGGIWAGTDVTIDGLIVTDTALNASGAAELGGLVYRASGKWTVSSIDLKGLTINTNDSTKALGLLVCHGEPYKEPINNTTANIGGLYLEMSQYWGTGYKVPAVSGFGSGVFDEFVAYTAYRSTDTNYDITHNGSGIISLQTKKETDNTYSVHMTLENRNTYENRTGVSATTNKYSRYYYNLPEVVEGCKNVETSGNAGIDTAGELLIWSVYRYAAPKLQSHFRIDSVDSNTIGGSSDTRRATFDMKGLSYYPISITNADVIVKYADITFYNKAIEDKEAPQAPDKHNKSTRGTDSDHTQHYMMHVSLFHDFKAENIPGTKDYTLTVNGVTFAGTVGVVNNGSGALVCGRVAGESSSGNTAICKIILADEDNAGIEGKEEKAVKLNGISVDTTAGYCPVLINKIGDYTSLSAKHITSSYDESKTAGSSLIGDVGSENASKLNIAFGGTIKLPEQKSEGKRVFTRATLLNSLRYATGSAVYNFPITKDYSNLTYVHNATHGWELGDKVSVEYVDDNENSILGKYQSSAQYVSKTSEFDTPNNFSGDLPYVYDSPATKVDSTHTVANKWHELAVNLPSTKLDTGCGTYGHPYQVNAITFRAIANFVNGGDPVEGWTVCVPGDPTTYHSDANSDYTLKYENGTWKNITNDQNVGDSTYNTENVRTHLQSAYYQLSEHMALSNFNGIGATEVTAFKGVIDGNNKTITLSGTSEAFIKYSYGSVVRNVTFDLQQTPTLTWTDPGRKEDGTTQEQQAPDTFFGGVIGCVLGGDNIIDNVSVKSTKGTVTPDGTNLHLVPIGGYVGVIAGGGVIFRGDYGSVNTEGTGITGTDVQLYRNPIIGRVLGGYAFHEAPENGGTAPDNGNKDYKINTLSGSSHLSWNGETKKLTVNSAQGLLILSAIVSSGAGSTRSNAYAVGKARNAAYDSIGSIPIDAEGAAAQKDAGAVWGVTGQTPYLLSKYAGYSGNASICTEGTDGITIQFAQDQDKNPLTFNMIDYGNGYRGLSARYVSNAAFVRSAVTPSAVVMRVKTFDGQNANVQNINMDVKEYNNDDFHMASMGGIFNIIWTQQQSGGGGVGSNFAQNLTLTNCNVSLMYVNSSGVEQNEASTITFSREDGMRTVSVGGFIGMANDVDADSNTQKTKVHNYLFTNIHIKDTGGSQDRLISGPNSVGGLIGTTAMASTGVKGYPGKLLANGKWALFGPSFLNCSYSNITVTGGLAAGGLVGDAYINGNSTVPNFYGLGLEYKKSNTINLDSFTSCTVTDEKLIVGQNSIITARAKGSIAGGLFGGAGMRVGVNDPEINTKFTDSVQFKIIDNKSMIKPLRLQSVAISVSTTDYDPGSADRPDSSINNAYAAGIIGRIGNVNPSCFYDISIKDGGVTSTNATSSRVGGIQGSGFTNSEIIMERCEISSFTLSGVNTGGFLGNGQNYSQFKLHMSDCKLTESSVSGTNAGGLVGNAQSYYYLYNILIKNTSITNIGKNSVAGRLFGKVEKDKGYIYASGISVYSEPGTPSSMPEKDIGDGSITAGYIAYADYAGTDIPVKDQKAPYVTVNPNFLLPGTSKTLYGDAVGKIEADTYNSVAARIWADQEDQATGKKNLVSYQNVTSIAKDNKVPTVLTFQKFQKYKDEESAFTNFPVLVLKGGDASPILNYLNVITNGGYNIAKEKASGYVTIENPKVYCYDEKTNQFRETTDDDLKDAPASIIKTASNTFEVKTGSFDNTRNRFTLLEFKFKTTVNRDDKFYTVSIPVVVERELQYDFMATFTPGTVFKKDFYSNLCDHILESSGTPITAYLTYRYNRNKNSYVEYDWQSYLTKDGLDMLIGNQIMDKTLTFDGGLPKDTQMILIDCQNGNQAYKYAVTAADGITSVPLSAFTSVCNDEVLFRPSLGVVLGITAAEDSANGKFVRTTDPSNAILLKDGQYYRWATDTDTGTHYTLTVPDLKTDTAEENYYLVITVPATDDPTYKLNGNLSSQLIWGVPNSGTQVHRYNPTIGDNRSQTESTYQISSGYLQSLTASPETVMTQDVATVSTPLKINLLDTISFDKAQLYNENDRLYLKFSASLMSFLVDKNQKTTSKLVQFPVGTKGTVNFYVQDEIGNHYFPTDTGWKCVSSKPEPISYDWESNGANIELLLSTDGRTALDLSGVRTAVKGQDKDGIGKILITAQMDVYFGSENILEDTIPASANGNDAYAQMHYVSRISTLEGSLDTSTVRATQNDKVQYYRLVQTNASLSMDASNIDQLGVNPLQLVTEDQVILNGKNASLIDLAATLDLVTPEKAHAFLENTETLRFSLRLYRRNGEQNGEKYFELINQEDADNLLAVKWSEAGGDGTFGWSYDIPRSSFAGNNVDPQLFSGTMFTIPLTAYVYTDPMHFANYKLEVAVSFLDASGNEVAELPIIDKQDAYVVYTYACIKPSFYEPQSEGTIP